MEDSHAQESALAFGKANAHIFETRSYNGGTRRRTHTCEPVATV